MRTYGKLWFAADEWLVEAEPHVMIRLRRLFHRAVQNAGRMSLRHTDEVARDLLWVLERYPLEVSPADFGILKRYAAAFDARAEMFAGLFAGRVDPRPFDLAIQLRAYQKIAADLALRAGGLLIADDVGLGKTAMAIATLTEPATRPALVVTLTHLPRQWEREIQKFAPALTTHIIRKGTPYPIGAKRSAYKQLSLALALPDVLITNYHKLAGWRDVLAGNVRSVIFDEIQELRHPESDKARAARHIAGAAQYRTGLSATPIYNYGSEFFNVLDVLRPDCLGTRGEFLREWCGGYDAGGKSRIRDPKAFGTYVREQGLMIRRTRSDVGRELPPVTKVPHHVDCDEGALDAVRDSVVALAKFLLERQGTTLDRMQAGGELDWRVRQATGIAKAPYVAEFVRLLVEGGERVVLFGWHRAVYRIWEERLKPHCRIAVYTGEESSNQKDEARRDFVDGGAQVLIMSLRAGAGLDGLQHACRTVVFGELDWSPGVHEQNLGRVFRDGQKDPVVGYFLVSDEGSDPVIADVLGLKKAQIDGVRDPHAALVERLEAPEDGIRKLAESVLRAHGVPLGEPVVGSDSPMWTSATAGGRPCS